MSRALVLGCLCVLGAGVLAAGAAGGCGGDSGMATGGGGAGGATTTTTHTSTSIVTTSTSGTGGAMGNHSFDSATPIDLGNPIDADLVTDLADYYSFQGTKGQ